MTVEGPGACALLPMARQGDVVLDPRGGGSLAPVAWANPACSARGGAIAFVAGIGGPATSGRNQGIFVADASGLRAIAIGSGGEGGAGNGGASGDAAPGGGTFAGFFRGTPFAPAIDESGSVLFLTDLNGAASPRALVLFEATTAAFVRVAAVGDPAPGGGTFAAVGPGVLGNGGRDAAASAAGALRTVAFVARRSGASGAEYFWWRAGATHVLAAIGDPASGGGTYAVLASESLQFVDGSTVPIGPLPTVDDCGAVAFRAQAAGRTGIVHRADLAAGGSGTDRWFLRTGDPAPGGGVFAAFEGPVVNGTGAIAVFADVALGAGATTAGWFVGRPGAFRRALAFFDPVPGGQCLGLAVSRGPMAPLDDADTLSLWCDLALTGGVDCIVEVAADGVVRTIVQRGDPAPGGGVFGAIDAWPARASPGRTVVSARVLGGTTADGHFAAVSCAPQIAATPCAPIGGQARLDTQVAGSGVFVLAAALATTELELAPWGTLRIGPNGIQCLIPWTTLAGPAGASVDRVPMPAAPALVGLAVHFQALVLEGPAATPKLTNRTTTVLGP